MDAATTCDCGRYLALSLLIVSSIRPLIGSLFVLSVVACGGSGEYRKTGGTYAGRGPDCDYRVIRNRIVEPYEELGVVDIAAFSVPQLPSNEDEFRKVVGTYVCESGGHAVIPAVNMQGRWVHGTIIRFGPSECQRCRPDGIILKKEEG
ncbi:MAG: hypothetical protein JRF42_05020 [Deltaproteobacteria bacterium]|nr:hypothetical protein [Deltaproteobacteria bacterium]MBW2548223.1 hypothetical protein [Deltaproteobacteria bacterium]MBW2719840.1 hypothetical protein [Deltaproteobacteria bacterium]